MKAIEIFEKKSLKDKIIIKNVTFSFVIKGIALLVSFFSTPAFIGYFGNDVVLGVWFTLLSVLTWVLSFDLGIGNGIRNNLVKAFSENDEREARSIISSGLISIVVAGALIFAVGTAVIFCADVNELFNVSAGVISQKTLKLSVFFVFLAICLRFVLTFVSSLFYALQLSAVNDLLTLAAGVFQFVFALVFRFGSAEEALLRAAEAYAVIANFPLLAAGIILFLTKLKCVKPEFGYITKEHCKKVLSVGGMFFLCQVFYMLIVNTNEFFITRFFSPELTTEYSFYYKITSVLSMAVTLAMTPVWSVVTKALAEKDFVWIKKLYGKIRIFGAITIVLQFAVIPFLQPLMNVWLGEGKVTVTYSRAVIFAFFGGAFAYSGMLSSIVCGMGKVKLQAIAFGTGAAIKIVFSVFAEKLGFGWESVVLCNATILAVYCVLQTISLEIFIKNNGGSAAVKNKGQEENVGI